MVTLAHAFRMISLAASLPGTLPGLAPPEPRLSASAQALLEWARAQEEPWTTEDRNHAAPLAGLNPKTLWRAGRDLAELGLIESLGPRGARASRSTLWRARPVRDPVGPVRDPVGPVRDPVGPVPRANGTTSLPSQEKETLNVTSNVSEREDLETETAREFLALIREARAALPALLSALNGSSGKKNDRTGRAPENTQVPAPPRAAVSEPLPDRLPARRGAVQWGPDDETSREVMDRARELRELSNRSQEAGGFQATFAEGAEQDLRRFDPFEARRAVQSALLRVAKGDSFKRKDGGQSSPLAAVFAVLAGRIGPEEGAAAPWEEVLAKVSALEAQRKGAAERARQDALMKDERRRKAREDQERQRAAHGLPPLPRSSDAEN